MSTQYFLRLHTSAAVVVVVEVFLETSARTFFFCPMEIPKWANSSVVRSGIMSSVTSCHSNEYCTTNSTHLLAKLVHQVAQPAFTEQRGKRVVLPSLAYLSRAKV